MVEDECRLDVSGSTVGCWPSPPAPRARSARSARPASTWPACWTNPRTTASKAMALVRALRKWLQRNPKGSPLDQLIVLGSPKVAVSKGQHDATTVPPPSPTRPRKKR